MQRTFGTTPAGVLRFTPPERITTDRESPFIRTMRALERRLPNHANKLEQFGASILNHDGGSDGEAA